GITLPTAAAALAAVDQTRLVALATLAATCRSAVERDPYTREIVQVYQSESPARLAKVLARLLAGMLAIGVEPDAAWTTLTKTGLDCMPALRRLVFDWLITYASAPTPDGIASAVGYPSATTTIRRTLQDLAAHGVLIEGKGGKSSKASEWSVSDQARELYATATAAGS